MTRRSPELYERELAKDFVREVRIVQSTLDGEVVYDVSFQRMRPNHKRFNLIGRICMKQKAYTFVHYDTNFEYGKDTQCIQRKILEKISELNTPC